MKEQLHSYELNYSLQQVTYAQALAEVERNVTKSFYYLLAETKNLELQLGNLEMAEKQYAKVSANYDSGYASELELLSSQLGVERLKPSYQQTLNAYRTQLLGFKVLLGLPLDTELELVGRASRPGIVGRSGFPAGAGVVGIGFHPVGYEYRFLGKYHATCRDGPHLVQVHTI